MYRLSILLELFEERFNSSRCTLIRSWKLLIGLVGVQLEVELLLSQILQVVVETRLCKRKFFVCVAKHRMLPPLISFSAALNTFIPACSRTYSMTARL